MKSSYRGPHLLGHRWSIHKPNVRVESWKSARICCCNIWQLLFICINHLLIRCIAVEEHGTSNWFGESLLGVGHCHKVLRLNQQLAIVRPKCSTTMCEWQFGWKTTNQWAPCSLDLTHLPRDQFADLLVQVISC